MTRLLSLFAVLSLALAASAAHAGKCYGGTGISCIAGYYDCTDNSECLAHDCSVCENFDARRAGARDLAVRVFSGSCSATGSPGCSISCGSGQTPVCFDGAVDDGVAVPTPGDCYCE
jgi:hypothetical protein